MKLISHAIIGVAVVTSLTLGAAGALSAQGKSGAARARHAAVTPAPKGNPSNSPNAAPKANSSDSFKGIANKLGTTPEALQSAYAAAKQANPKLTRGQFVAANMLAHNLGSKNPAITTQAILDGLKSGKSIGQTLQGLGLNEKDADEAERQAKRDATEAQQAKQ